jgi:molecular chaperone DnaJ
VSKEEHKLEVNAPPGVEHGHAIRFNGLGDQPQRESDIPGDLYVVIAVQDHPLFRREGIHHLQYQETLTLAESIVGKTITIPHFGGDITLNTAELGIVQPHRNYCIEKKGMTSKGNLLVKFPSSIQRHHQGPCQKMTSAR